MALSVLRNIPIRLTSRLVLQLCAIPADRFADVDWNTTISTQLNAFGRTDDISGFLDACLDEYRRAQRARGRATSNEWRTVRVIMEEDFEFLAGNIASTGGEAGVAPKPNPVGIRVELLNDQREVTSHSFLQPRSKISLQFVTPNPEYHHMVETYDRIYHVRDKLGQPHPVNAVLSGTLDYIIQRATHAESGDAGGPINEENVTVLGALITREMARVEERAKRVGQAVERVSPTTMYILMGALMRGGTGSREWMLYMKDFVTDGEDIMWKRIWGEPVGLAQDDEDTEMVSEDDVLSHLQGKPPESTFHHVPSPSLSLSHTPTSPHTHTPWYLFYISRDTLTSLAPDPTEATPADIDINLSRLARDTTIHLGDGTPAYSTPADTEGDYIMLDPDILCKLCSQGEEWLGNKIFMCDGCDRGIHQLCQKPKIEDEEERRDPWVCADCLTVNQIALGGGLKRKWDDAEGVGGREG
ncbi:hypothetical protein BC936DRAFT_137786 [Jimgerdemannia flammicorona]|uniref:PHD-type domain-containing protein n=1 Tax=Jimgerdemannia flammicorona TaxID=994334 RepID=A0A433CWP9_9FUNG|nr:hypothetical protein BC936DRAFT_137786 [Jimgerdemannia flammicorona]